MTTPKRTPTPWKIEKSWMDWLVVGPENQEIIWQDGPYETPTISKSDADFIVRAVNAHEELVEALEAVMKMDVKGHQLQGRLQFSDSGRAILNKARTALAKARGEDCGQK